MATQWLRLWHDMPNDPKWRTIAKVSKQSISSVIAVYVHILVIASNAIERGRTHAACSEDIASALDMEEDQVASIIDAMQGRVLDGEVVAGWSKRQVEREDGSAARSKAWREAKKQQKSDDSNAIERNRTQDERKRTPDKDTDKDTELEKRASKPALSSRTISLKTYLENCKAVGAKPIPDEHFIRAYCRDAGIETDMLALAWVRFREEHTNGTRKTKRYIDWPGAFANSVKDRWYRLWVTHEEGPATWTSEGLQARRVADAKAQERESAQEGAE